MSATGYEVYDVSRCAFDALSKRDHSEGFGDYVIVAMCASFGKCGTVLHVVQRFDTSYWACRNCANMNAIALCNAQVSDDYVFEYEVWHLVASEPDTYDELLDDYVFPDMHSVEYHVYLSDEECDTPNDVVKKRIGNCTFSIYMDAEDFAVRNVCEGIPSVLITNTYDAYWGEIVEDAVRFLRWSGDSVKLNYRSKTFCTDQCRIFELPTKNGSIYEKLSGLMQLRRAGVR